MRKRVAPIAAGSKNGRCPIRQPKLTKRQRISPVMQKVRGLLPAAKPAVHLHLLTGASLSTCEKVLCGQRAENLEIFLTLLRSDLGRDVLFAAMGDASPDWFVRYRKQLDVNAVRRQLAETERAIAALQKEASE